MSDLDADLLDSSALLKRHAELEESYGDGDGGRFLSGWQCENPWAGDLKSRITEARTTLADENYQNLDDDSLILEGLREFHALMDRKAPSALFCGEGASALLFTTCAWLKTKGIKEVFYIPPLYFSLHFALNLLGIRARPVSGRQAYESAFTLNLPNQTAALLLSDPIWYAGIAVEEELVKQIDRWQRRTESFVFVDGSFQYMKWHGVQQEPTSSLSHDRTVRVICPTKLLALHGYRFAHATLPESIRADFSRIYTNLYGSASAESLAFGRVAVTALREQKLTSLLVELIASRHQALRLGGKISADWQANCGYFVFERILAPLPKNSVMMDGTFFQQKRYPNHHRINLLSPSIGLLG